MTSLLRHLLLLASLWLGAGATSAAPPRAVSVTVSRATGGDWYADYALAEPARVWVFTRSNPDMDGAPWRLDNWTVETPGVSLVRIGRWDALVADRGTVPARVRVRMRPVTKSLRADYTPFLSFSDGGVAIYSDQFLVAPRASIAAVTQLPDDIGTLPGFERPNVVTLDVPGRRTVAKGVVGTGRAQRLVEDPDLYFYTGDAAIVETPALAGIFDAALPGWLRGELDSFVPRVFNLYRARLGDPVGGRPMALVSWTGADRSGISFGGSVLTGTVVMAIGGKQAAQPSPEATERMRWFIGHEGAHFWMGQTVGYVDRRGAWITEGAADLMAIRALQRLVPGYDPRPELQDELDKCLKLNGAAVPLATAEARGQTGANYACGAMLTLVAEGAMRLRDPGGDVFTFLRDLIDRNRAGRKVDAAKWLAAYRAAGGGQTLSERIAAYVERGDADPVGLYAALFTASGIPFTRDGDRLTLR